MNRSATSQSLRLPICGLLTAFALLETADAQSTDERVLDVRPPSITVFGVGEVSAPPDTAEITVGVTTQAATAAEAVTRNSTAVQSVLDALKAQEIAESDLETTSFHVNPVYRHDDPPRPSSGPTIVGYQVSNQVKVTVRELGGLGSMLDATLQAGANQVHGIRLFRSNPQELKAQALRQAVADARRKADLLAEATAARVGAPLHVVEESSPERPMFAETMSLARADVPIARGEQTYRASVVISYALIAPNPVAPERR